MIPSPAAADRHIAELETENASLRTRVAFLESKLAAQAGGPVQMVRTIVPTVESPTPDEMRRLCAIVSAKWPQARSSRNADDALRRFTNAFAYLASSVSHSDKRSRFAASAWVDRVRRLPSHRRPAGQHGIWRDRAGCRRARVSAFAVRRIADRLGHLDYRGKLSARRFSILARASRRRTNAGSDRDAAEGERLESGRPRPHFRRKRAGRPAQGVD